MFSSFTYFCILLLVIQRTTFGIKCYDCNRGTDGCGKSFSSKGAGVIEDFGPEQNLTCIKIVHNSNDNAIDRLMGANNLCNAESPVDKISIYCCNTDLCNESPIKSSSSFTFVMATAGLSLSLYIK